MRPVERRASNASWCGPRTKSGLAVAISSGRVDGRPAPILSGWSCGDLQDDLARPLWEPSLQELTGMAGSCARKDPSNVDRQVASFDELRDPLQPRSRHLDLEKVGPARRIDPAAPGRKGRLRDELATLAKKRHGAALGRSTHGVDDHRPGSKPCFVLLWTWTYFIATCDRAPVSDGCALPRCCAPHCASFAARSRPRECGYRAEATRPPRPTPSCAYTRPDISARSPR